jgi:hypothetical protein
LSSQKKGENYDAKFIPFFIVNDCHIPPSLATPRQFFENEPLPMFCTANEANIRIAFRDIARRKSPIFGSTYHTLPACLRGKYAADTTTHTLQSEGKSGHHTLLYSPSDSLSRESLNAVC